MDPSLYQQRQQQDRVLYPLSQTGSPANIPGYPQQYLTSTPTNNTSAYVGSGNGVNSMIQIAGNRPIYPAPVTVSSLSSNGMPPAKRVALGSPLQNVYQNIASNSMSSQLYSHSPGFPNQMITTGRSAQSPAMLISNPNVETKPTAGTVPTNIYVMEGANKYQSQYSQQMDRKLTVGSMNDVLNQSQVQQTPSQNTQQQNFGHTDDNDMYWVNIGDLNESDYHYSIADADYVGNQLDLSWSSPDFQPNLNFMSNDKIYSISQGQQTLQQQGAGDDQQQQSQELDEQNPTVQSQPSSQPHHSIPLQSLQNQQPPHLISSQQSQQREEQQQSNEDSIYALTVPMMPPVLSSQGMASKNSQQTSTGLLARSSSPTIQTGVESSNSLVDIFNNQSDSLELDPQGIN
jgi:hypothetical protein